VAAIVTCIYNKLHHTPLGGRNNREGRYNRSLRVIAQTNTQIFCFTSAAEYDDLVAEFSDVSNIQFIVFELKDVPYSEEIQRVKLAVADTSDRFWQERCFEVMWGKLHMMQHIIDNYPEFPKLFWMDAGLSHVDIISPKYRSKSDIESGHPELTTGLFTPLLSSRLEELADNKIIMITVSQVQRPMMPPSYNSNGYATLGTTVGGLFGGWVPSLRKFIANFFQKAYAAMNDGLLFSEETIFYALYTDNPEDFVEFHFNSWYHEGWDVHNPELRNFTTVIDEILTPRNTNGST
jgi:hypothetical protein